MPDLVDVFLALSLVALIIPGFAYSTAVPEHEAHHFFWLSSGAFIKAAIFFLIFVASDISSESPWLFFSLFWPTLFEAALLTERGAKITAKQIVVRFAAIPFLLLIVALMPVLIGLGRYISFFFLSFGFSSVLLFMIVGWLRSENGAVVRYFGASFATVSLISLFALGAIFIMSSNSVVTSQVFNVDFPLILLSVGSLGQTILFALIFCYSSREEKLRRSQLVPKLEIWTRDGFIKNSKNTREICARLNQPVSLVVFEIERYFELKEGRPHCEVENILLELTRSIRVCLRKHDQVGLIQENRFVLLLPFTDTSKGEIACARLRKQIQTDSPRYCEKRPIRLSLKFGLTLVDKKEINVEAAILRAERALSNSEADGGSTFRPEMEA